VLEVAGLAEIVDEEQDLHDDPDRTERRTGVPPQVARSRIKSQIIHELSRRRLSGTATMRFPTRGTGAMMART
jgi:hypothetical protein